MSQYGGIISATYRHMNVTQSDQLSNLNEYLQTCINMRSFVDSRFSGASDLASKAIEFHSFGVSGWTGGDAIAPMLWSIGHIPQVIQQLTKAQSALVITTFNEVIALANTCPTVYTVSTTSGYIYNKTNGAPAPSNLQLLNWSDLNSPPPVDLIYVANYVLADNSLVDSLVEALPIGGTLVVSNSSNGGELYNVTLPSTYAQDLHDRIMTKADFTSFLLQGYVSFTVYIKNGTS